MSGRTKRSKLDLLRDLLNSWSPSLIAVSGGIDSRFLSWTAVEQERRNEFIYFKGPHQDEAGKREALSWLTSLCARFHVVEFDPLAVPPLSTNPRDRCYLCKKHMFSKAREIAEKRGLRHILDGTQADDLTGYRPGRKAARELGVLSPLARTGLTKAEIRFSALEAGLSRPEQPARPCLLTRFPYGYTVTHKELGQIARGEEILRNAGIQKMRLRKQMGGEFLLQIDLREEKVWERAANQVVQSLRQEFITIRKVVYSPGVSGFFDKEEAHGKPRLLLGPEGE
ncbi:MAG: PP-loop superfamily ATP-utilizing enzyme [Desulfovibrionales bacterium]